MRNLVTGDGTFGVDGNDGRTDERAASSSAFALRDRHAGPRVDAHEYAGHVFLVEPEQRLRAISDLLDDPVHDENPGVLSTARQTRVVASTSVDLLAPVHRLSVEEYLRVSRLGLFDSGPRVELIDGGEHILSCQQAIRLPALRSMPEPDIAILDVAHARQRRPDRPLLIIEVAGPAYRRTDESSNVGDGAHRSRPSDASLIDMPPQSSVARRWRILAGVSRHPSRAGTLRPMSARTAALR